MNFACLAASLLLLTSAVAEDFDVDNSLDTELTLLEEDALSWEDEILALEEQLKEDAKEAEAIALSPINEQVEPVIQPVAIEAPIEPIEEPLALAPEKEPEALPISTKTPEELPVLNQVLEESPATLEIVEEPAPKEHAIQVDLDHAFASSPFIYSILLAMSTFAVCLWLYSLFSLRQEAALPSTFIKNLRNKLTSNHFDDALSLCLHHENLFAKMIATGIHTRRHGVSIMLESMTAEGKRASNHFWQRISLLNDIAVVAPMLGLLGTVLGMFYAFYDLNRSIESISTLFDGLGVSVGTTVAGLIVAILALILHSIAKYRLVQVLTHVEREAQAFVTLINENHPESRGS